MLPPMGSARSAILLLRVVEPQLPFKNGRSDLLTGSGSRLDIQNINLGRAYLAT